MKKNDRDRHIPLLTKTIRIMKVTSLCNLLAVCSISASTYAQSLKFSIHKQNSSISEVFKEIEKKSDFTFFFNDNQINVKQKVNVSANNASIEDVLAQVLQNTGYNYQIINKQILIKVSDKEVMAVPVVAQSDKKITGTVLDATGMPVIGANVMVKGTTNGTITDIDGKFSLEVSKDATLVVSYIGFSNQEIKVGNQTNLSIALKEDSKALDELVVVGYGVQKKVNLTGAVESVKAESITSKPVTSVAQALTGEAAGVTVIQRSSKPGANDETIRIRGVGTWGDANPLVLVDGVEMGMDKVNPNDIENISVLKDAAAASIYGSRAGNGVILITTKKGSSDKKPTVSFSSNVGVQVVTRFIEKDDALTYAKRKDKEFTNDGKSPKFTDMIAQMEAGKWDPDHLIANTDWLDEVLRPALQHNHNVSLTGGSKNFSYMASLGYLGQESVVGNNTDFERYNARLNTHSQITDWFGMDANMAYMLSTSREPACGTTEVMMRAIGIESYLPVQFSDGTYVHSSTNQNPVRMGFTDDYGKTKSTTNNFSGLISPELSKWGFKLKGLLAYERQNYRYDSFQKTVKFDSFTPAGASNPIQNEAVTVPENKKSDNWSALTNITLNATLSYDKTFGDHDLSVLLGCSRELYNYEYTNSSMSGFPNNDLDAIGAGTTKPTIAGDYTRQALSSYFGRINYVFKDRYLLEANIRRDGSSKFAKAHRWGTFPSGSVGWRISEEPFFKPLRGWIDNLKVRASYGRLGNNRIANFGYLSTIAVNGDAGYIFGDDVISNGYYESVMGNEFITWEKLESTNVGLDLSVLNNRLSVTGDYFVRNTKDILLQLPAPGTLGIDPPTSNAASVRNKGWEMTINWNDQIKDFKYNIAFNLSDVRNEVTDLKGYKAPTNELTILREGEPINALFGWEAIGICRTEEDYLKYKDQMQSISPKFALGDIIYKDRDNNGIVDGDDKTIIGNQIPRFTFGLRLGAEYKNFDFSCFFQGVADCDGYLTYETQEALYNTSNSFDAETNPNAPYPRLMGTHYYNSLNYSSFWVQDASYVRLKNIQLGYTFKMLQKYGISNLRLYFSGENIATITKYKGFDPESPIGMRGWMYPLVGVYSFGLNLSF